MKNVFFLLLVLVGQSTLANNQTLKLSCKAPDYLNFSGAIDTDKEILYFTQSDSTTVTAFNEPFNNLDERCGTLPPDFPTSYNFDITEPHTWGQDILQLPAEAVNGPTPASFKGNLHTCSYDGEWSISRDIELNCAISR